MKKISEEKLYEYLLILLALTPAIILAIVYGVLPDQVPLHYDFSGAVTNYGDKWILWILALLVVVIYLLMGMMPSIDPMGKNYDKFKGFYKNSRFIILIFFNAIFGITIANSISPDIVSVSTVMPILIGILFIYIGNNLPKAKQNYSFGIKTPWTLADEGIWNKTHRLGGYCFIAAGIIFLFTSIFISSMWGAITIYTTIMLCVVVPMYYSYYCYKKLGLKDK